MTAAEVVFKPAKQRIWKVCSTEMAGFHAPHSRLKCAKLQPNAALIACGAHGAIGMRAPTRAGKVTADALGSQYDMPCSVVLNAMERTSRPAAPFATSQLARGHARCIHGGHGVHAIDNVAAVSSNVPGKLYAGTLLALAPSSTTTGIHTPALVANTP